MPSGADLLLAAVRTLIHEFEVEGRGLHTGERSVVRVRPSPEGVPGFVRGGRFFPLSPSLADPSARRCTAVRLGSSVIFTVEHLLAAVAGTGTWNVEIDVDGPELPILDGSAVVWARRLLERSEPGRAVEPWRARAAFGRSGQGGRYRVEPAERPRFEVVGRVASGSRARARAVWDGDPDAFLREIAPARTFAFAEDVPEILASGLARGATTDSVVVLSSSGPVIGGPLRFPDEPARHKLLDLIGDFALIGRPVAAEIRARDPSHAGTREMLALAVTPGTRSVEDCGR